ncbi:hypothetical protein N7463_007768 [Penicillium fimorum]|uniref:Uncharacterized protein n=1 Tax=Penicillium fimorum TaxID=1882269 RepID=A0A9W9XWW9_9EURO|nr:hypothetical protein N7463_007768 [Penicillium fimorum]
MAGSPSHKRQKDHDQAGRKHLYGCGEVQSSDDGMADRPRTDPKYVHGYGFEGVGFLLFTT